MTIKKPIKGYKTIDIGPLDSFDRWEPPLTPQIIAMKHVVCSACRGRFQTDEAMIIGFKRHNFKGLGMGFRFHERCWDGSGKDLSQKKAGAEMVEER